MGEPSESPLMDPAIWVHLPPDLLEKVVARLPVAAVVRFRSVCRKFYQFPFDKQFIKLHAEVGSSPGFLKTVLVSSQKSKLKIPRENSQQLAIVYIEGSGKWRTIPLNFLPSRVTLQASGGGLLLFSQTDKYGRLIKALYVCNPITKEWKKLRMSTLRSLCHIGIDVDQSTYEYKVVVTGWNEKETLRTPWIEIFDSQTNCWEIKGNVSEEGEDEFYLLYGLLWLNGTLFSAINLGDIGDWWIFHCLGKYRVGLVIVGQRAGSSGIIEIWQLKKEENKWVFLDMLIEENMSRSSAVMAAVAGHLVCLSNQNDKLLALYDLEKQSWRWVDIPLDTKYWSGRPLLPFQASLVPLN